MAGYEDVTSSNSVRPCNSVGEANGAAVDVNDGNVEDRLESEIEEREERLRDIDIEIEEAVMPKAFARVYTPSKEEYDRHCLTHLPYRNWCPICVQAKRKNTGHFRVKEDRRIPVFSIDYMFLNGKESLGNPIVIVTEKESGGIWAIPVKKKGNYSDYVSRRIANIIDKVGYARCVLKSDQEPSIVVVTKVEKDSFGKSYRTLPRTLRLKRLR